MTEGCGDAGEMDKRRRLPTFPWTAFGCPHPHSPGTGRDFLIRQKSETRGDRIAEQLRGDRIAEH